MDIEGAEWDVLGTTDWEGAHVGQLLVELHDKRKEHTLGELLLHFMGRLEQAPRPALGGGARRPTL